MVKKWNSNILSKFFLLLLCCSFSGKDAKLISSFPVNARFLTTDNLGYSYLVKSDNELVKLDPSGKKQFTFSEKRYGKLEFVDATNPMNVLLFFSEFMLLITTDNSLSQKGIVDLQKAGFFKVSALARSFDNRFWIFDEINFRLKKIDDNAVVSHESDDLSQRLSNGVKPNFILEKNQWVYVNDVNLGILVFDIYATYFKTIPIKNLLNFQIINDQILYFKDNKCMSYNLYTLEDKELMLPEYEDLTQVRIEKERMYLLKKNQLDIYQY